MTRPDVRTPLMTSGTAGNTCPIQTEGWITIEAMSDGHQLCFDTKGICDWLVITFINVVQTSAACPDRGMAHK